MQARIPNLCSRPAVKSCLNHQGKQPDDEFQEFTLELEEINPLDTVKITSERLAQLQKATEQDPVMQTLKSTILVGWSNTRLYTPHLVYKPSSATYVKENQDTSPTATKLL